MDEGTLLGKRVWVSFLLETDMTIGKQDLLNKKRSKTLNRISSSDLAKGSGNQQNLL